jgi:MFS family permease
MPAFSSVVFGITTAAATLGALGANVIAGIVIKKPVLADWRKLFILFAVIYVIGGLIFAIYGSASARKWATHQAQTERQKKIKQKKEGEEEAVPMQPSETTQTAAP